MSCRLASTLILWGSVGLTFPGFPSTRPALAASPDSPTTRLVGAESLGRDARQPQVAVDPTGRIYVAFGVGNTIRCARSSDRGQTFEVFPVGAVDALALGTRRGPRIAVAGNSVVVSAIGGRQGKGRDGDLVAWRSTDQGATWTAPTRVNTVEGSAREGLHAMAGHTDGSVFSTWLDLRAGRTEIFGARSRDVGASWEPDQLVYRAPGGSVCECCHPSAAYGPDGTLCLTWRNQVQRARDLYLIRSSDGGSTFGPAEKLGEGTWPLTACPMDGGAVALGPDGQIETAWMRQGAIFEAQPGRPERRLGRGVQCWTAVGPTGPTTVWLDARPGRLLAKRPGDPNPITLAEAAIDPTIAAGPWGRPPTVAVWEKKGGGIDAAILDPPGTASTRSIQPPR